ncbi:MAG: archaeosortase/exosortase family protein [Phycisphaerae bacterium]|nr:archaeosortase/exosortase family protein [Phycisphaerae bacterium]
MKPPSAQREAAREAPTVAASRRRGAWFIAVFLGVIGAFYVFSQFGVFQSVIAPGSMRLSALSAAPFIRLLGDPVDVNGTMLVSPRGRVEVQYGCDALEPIVYFIAAVLAFPATWRGRLFGIAVGVPALFALNIVRIASLYFIATRRADWFDVAHRDLWQPIFIAATLALWMAWAMLHSGARAARPAP